MKARWLLIISAVLAWLFALMLLFNAKAFEAPVGIVLDAKTATLAQAQGAILLGLGVINWMARKLLDNHALEAVLAGNLVVQIASLIVAGRAVITGIFPPKGAPAIIIHVILGAAFAFYLWRIRREGQTTVTT